MMLFKLSIKNIKKSIKDYAIYFFTLILGVSIFYVFNALDSQTIMIDVSSSTSEIIQLMMTILSGVSVFVSFTLGFLIIYATRFLMKRRNKEFGIYLTLGMSKRKISLILFFETLLIGILSLFIGIVLGVFLSQVMSLLVANMFEADLTKFKFIFSSSSAIKTIIYFSIMYLIVILFNTFSVSKCKLIDLLYSSKKSEKIKLKNPYICIILFIISIVVLGRAYYIVTHDYMALSEVKDILKPIVMGIVSTFFIFYSLSGLILRIVQSLKHYYYKGLNSFVFREFSSKVNTIVLSISIICLMLFVTICLLSSCFTIKNSMNKNFKELVPVDADYSVFMNMQNNYEDYIEYGYNEEQISTSNYTVKEKFKLLGFDIIPYFKDYIEVNLYATPELKLCNTLGSKLNELKEKYEFLDYDSEEEVIMGINEYNKVAKMYGTQEYTLKDNEYMIIADYKSMAKVRDIALKNRETISLFGHTLTPKYTQTKNGFVEMSSNHINTGIILVPDKILDKNYIYENHLIGNYKLKNEEEIRELEENINKLDSEKDKYVLPNGATKLSIKEATVGLTAMVTFIGLYLGIIFLISSAAILALKELSESSDNKEKFQVLRKIGTDEKLINKALFRQIAIIFLLPLILALIHSVFGIKFAIQVLEVFGNEELIPSIIITTIILVIIYGGYFMITYFNSKNIIRNRN